MKANVFGRVLAALLLLTGVPAAQASSISGGSGAGSVTGGACPSGQYATSISAGGVPICATPGGAGLISGLWYTLMGSFGVGTVGITANSARCSPGIARATTAIQALGAYLTQTGTANVSLAIYANDPTTNNPTGLPIASLSTSLNINTAGAISGPASGTLQAGSIYWACSNTDATSGIFASNGATGIMSLIGSASPSGIPLGPTAGITGKSTSLTYTTTWPNAASLTWTSLGAQIVSVAYQAQ